ncbi:MAG: hypothetical protein LBQ97_06660 [Fusobacteriaceae bacterium]|nr:hypothetical protein [Fusobacteriaceae bacterium]
MEKNIRIIKNEDSITLNVYNWNIYYPLSMMLILWFVIFVFFHSIITVIIFITLYLCDRFSENAFERMVIKGEKITITRYPFPFFLRYETISIPNNEKMHFYYKEYERDKIVCLESKLFPRYFRRQDINPFVLFSWRLDYFDNSDNLRAIHIVYDDEDIGFGTLLPKEDYNEIIALILAQRARWEKEHETDPIPDLAQA